MVNHRAGHSTTVRVTEVDYSVEVAAEEVSQEGLALPLPPR
jgi:hypothetical protein